MTRLHVLVPLSLLALAAGCAPMRQPGMLSDVGARVTNEAISEDGLTFEAWSRRVSALRRDGAAPDPHRAYVAARAAAWLAYARDAYAWDPRDGVADTALAETRRLVLALESGTTPEPRPLVPATDARARPDLWAVLDRARGSSAVTEAPSSLAGAEIALVRAARLVSVMPGRAGVRVMTDVERDCQLQQQVTTAERLLNGLSDAPPATVVAMAPMPEPAHAVMLQGEPLPAVRPVARPAPAPMKHGVERVVHFAVNSSSLALSSRVTLGEVIAMLRTHPGVSLVIEGYTDARGHAGVNRELAVRRADAVRQFLDAANVALGRVTISGIGTDSAATAHATIRDFARDRRVTLTFTDADGTPLTPAAYQLFDIDHERDLQVEGARSSAARAHGARRLPATTRPLPR